MQICRTGRRRRLPGGAQNTRADLPPSSRRLVLPEAAGLHGASWDAVGSRWRSAERRFGRDVRWLRDWRAPGGSASGFEHDDGCHGRPAGCTGVEADVNLGPAPPQAIALLPSGRTCAHWTRVLARQSHERIGVSLEVYPPSGVAFVPAVHREGDEVRSVFDVADDDVALSTGLPTDGCETQCAPATLARGGPQESPAAEPVERAVNPPCRVNEPRRRQLRRSGRSAHLHHLAHSAARQALPSR